MKEVLIYGEIGTEVDARRIIDEIGDEKQILIRINSYGGDVFEAQTIYNRLRQLEVDVKIDGICASAATLIACAGKRVTMPMNGIYMTHLPVTWLAGYYNSIDIEKTKNRLEKITETILEVYSRKTGQNIENLRKLIENETWLNVEEAKSQGFIDTILEKDPEVENRIRSIKMLVDESKVKSFMENQRENETSLFEKFKMWLKTEDKARNEVEIERKRIETLSGVETTSTAQKAIIELAKKDGRTLDQIQPELDAIGIAENDEKKRVKTNEEFFFKMLKDYFNSGSEGVTDNPEIRDDGISEVVRYAKELKK